MANKLETPQALRRPRLAIFDFDGVIADSEVIALEELAAEMTERGAAVSYEEARAMFLGVSTRRHMEFIEERSGTPCASDFPDVWHGRLFQRYTSELATVDGAGETLDVLDRQGIAYCIASGGSPERIGFALDCLGLRERFREAFFSAEAVPRGKPAPDLFLHAAARMGYAAGECVVIEDAVLGVQAAAAAGMACIGFVGGRHLAGIREAHRRALAGAGAILSVDGHDALQMLLERPDFRS